MAQHSLEVQGQRCYELGLAWASGRSTRVTVGFEKNADGTSPNEQIGRRTFALEPPNDDIEICVDNPGTVLLTLTATTERGSLANNVSFEYALAVRDRAESDEERAQRQEREQSEVAASRARIETNLQASDRRRGGEAFARGCARCRASYYGCQRKDQGDCQLEFETCAQAMGVDARGRIQCAQP